MLREELEFRVCRLLKTFINCETDGHVNSVFLTPYALVNLSACSFGWLTGQPAAQTAMRLDCQGAVRSGGCSSTQTN